MRFWSVFPLFTLSRLNGRADPALPYPSAARSEYENQTATAISDQEQQTSGRSYQGRTGKAINCQSLHRSTSQPPPPPLPLPPLPASIPAHRLACTLRFISLYAAARTRARTPGTILRRVRVAMRSGGSGLSLTLRRCRFFRLDSAFLSVRCVRAAT